MLQTFVHYIYFYVHIGVEYICMFWSSTNLKGLMLVDGTHP